VRASDSSDKGWLAVQSHEAQNLYVESNRAGQKTAVVAWMGYDDPPDGLTAVAFAPFESHHGAAAERAGGILLAQDTNGLAATHQGSPSHVTWVGHSAGAIVVADAAVSGVARQHVNDVVLVGPVSTDLAHKATDFHLPPGHVYVGESSIDGLARPAHIYLNVMSHVLGQGGDADPTAPGYGATRFKAETPPSSNTWYHYNRNAHLAYFDPGSESLFSMSDIVSNNGHLTSDGMTATPDKLVSAPGRAGWEGLKVNQPGETTVGVTDDHYHPEQ
jgi:hypothetical protein